MKALWLSALLAVALSSVAEAKIYVPGTHTKSGLGYKPRKFTGGSGVGGGTFFFKRMHWHHWAKTAKGRGRITYNDCSPDCAGGSQRTVSVKIRLAHPKRGCTVYGKDGSSQPRHERVFTVLYVDAKGFNNLKTTTLDTGSGYNCTGA